VAIPESSEHDKYRVWTELCRETGWVCRICGEIPDFGQEFEGNLCDECRARLRNE
jgi:hypothetical protein